MFYSKIYFLKTRQYIYKKKGAGTTTLKNEKIPCCMIEKRLCTIGQ
jgi:hypothetical protein